MPLVQLARESVDARIELHQRLALPLACLLLALLGIPLGLSSRKAGKSAAVVTTVLLAFLYYMGLISLIGLAKQGTVPVELAVWTPNAVLALLAMVLLARLERPGDRDVLGAVRGALLRARFRPVRALSPEADRRPAGFTGRRPPAAAAAAVARYLHPVFLLPALFPAFPGRASS